MEYRKSGEAISHESGFEVGPFMLTVSQGKSNSRALDLLSNRDTPPSVHTQGLFAEHMKASSRKLNREFRMHPVLDAMITAIVVLGFPSLIRASDVASSSECDAKTFLAETSYVLANALRVQGRG